MEGHTGKRPYSENAGDDILLIGNIMTESGRTVIDVMPQMGDAKEFGLAGQFTILNKQIISTNRAGRFDVIRIPAHVARALKTPLPKPKRKR